MSEHCEVVSGGATQTGKRNVSLLISLATSDFTLGYDVAQQDTHKLRQSLAGVG